MGGDRALINAEEAIGRASALAAAAQSAQAGTDHDGVGGTQGGAGVAAKLSATGTPARASKPGVAVEVGGNRAPDSACVFILKVVRGNGNAQTTLFVLVQ